MLKNIVFNDDNPWGSSDNKDNVKKFKPSKKSDGPPTFEEISKRFKGYNGGGNNGNTPPQLPQIGNFIYLVPIIAFVLWLASGFYRVQEGEVAVVLRFGEMIRSTSPGLHYHLPYPIEQEIIQKVSAINKIDNRRRDEASIILTGDENMVFTDYTVLWKIRDLGEFLFVARDLIPTIEAAAESAIRQILGQTTARLALTEGREKISQDAQELIQKILDSYGIGVQIISFQLQSVKPPKEVVEAFNDMQSSLVDADRIRNEAEAYRNEILPRARGQAAQVNQEAIAYRQKIVADAHGNAARFDSVYEAYRNNPNVTMRRFYLDTMEKVLDKADKTIIDSKVGGGVMPYVNLQNKK